MIKMRSQIRDFFKYKKTDWRACAGHSEWSIKSNNKNKETQKYANIVNLTNQNMKKYLQKVTN